MNVKITFPELIELVASATNTSKRMSELFLKELFATVSQSLIEGESVRIKKLGQFKVEEVKARKSVSVHTGQEVEIPVHRRIVFTPAQSLADAVNEPFAHFETVVLDDAITDEQLEALDVMPSVEVDDAPDDVEETDAQEAAVEEVTPPVFTLATPPPFKAPQPVAEIPPIPQQEPEPIPEPEPVPVPVPEPIPEVTTPVSDEEEEWADADDGFSIVEFEREKRDIARRSTIRGIIYGAVGMLVVLLVAIVAFFYK